MKPNEFVTKLIETHGEEKARDIIETNLKISTSGGAGLFLYNEVNWGYDPKTNQLSFPKELDKKHSGLKQKREQKTRNFYNNALIELNKKVKNG